MLYGVHISTAGKLLSVPERAKAMGAETFQMFISNPRGWRPTLYTDADGEAFREACQKEGITKTFAHMIYLVSYGAADAELRQKSITAMSQALVSADQLGLTGVVTHMGSHKGLGFEQALSRISEALLGVLEASETSDLILENSAGGGGNMCNSLDEIAAVIDACGKHPRIKVCIDTAHLFTSGYDIRTTESWGKFIKEFDTKIGLDRLGVMHLNDSKADLDSHVDRHENIGHGFIGNDGFAAIINHSAVKDVPGILEVPGMDGNGPDKPNLDQLKKLTHA